MINNAIIYELHSHSVTMVQWLKLLVVLGPGSNPVSYAVQNALLTKNCGMLKKLNAYLYNYSFNSPDVLISHSNASICMNH